MGARKKSRSKKEPWQAARPAPVVALPPVELLAQAAPLTTEPLPADLAGLSLDYLLRRLGAVISFSIKRLYRSDYSVIPLSELDDETALNIRNIKFETLRDGDLEPVGYVAKELGHYDLMRAIELYAELKGWKGGADESRKKDRLSEVIAAMKEGPVERKEKK